MEVSEEYIADTWMINLKNHAVVAFVGTRLRRSVRTCAGHRQRPVAEAAKSIVLPACGSARRAELRAIGTGRDDQTLRHRRLASGCGRCSRTPDHRREITRPSSTNAATATCELRPIQASGVKPGQDPPAPGGRLRQRARQQRAAANHRRARTLHAPAVHRAQGRQQDAPGRAMKKVSVDARSMPTYSCATVSLAAESSPGRDASTIRGCSLRARRTHCANYITEERVAEPGVDLRAVVAILVR